MFEMRALPRFNFLKDFRKNCASYVANAIGNFKTLAIIAIIGVVLQFTGVTLMMLLGYHLIGQMAMPRGFIS
jgi:hypothetical protein